jgi:lipopolysaccharide/colanic/teichoic acid biosynthesis glycosyltransferase
VIEVPLALVGLLVTSPLLALAALAITLTSRGGVLFRQERVGRAGRRFVMLKLRTMRPAGGGPQVTSSDDRRITGVGRLLRSLKLDEVPELWNVARGDMSLVGPRPEVPRYVDEGDPLWQVVLRARPGVTDPMTLRLRNEEKLLAAVKGDHEEFYVRHLQRYKLNGYVEYLEGRSAVTDLGVLWHTVLAVLRPARAPLPTLEEIVAGADADGGFGGRDDHGPGAE